MLLNSARLPKVYRLRGTQTTDSYGDPVGSWDAPSRQVLRGADVQELDSIEAETASSDVFRNTRRLFVAGSPDLRATDRIEAEGDTWRIDGKPLVRRGLASGVYTACRLLRVTGGED